MMDSDPGSCAPSLKGVGPPPNGLSPCSSVPCDLPRLALRGLQSLRG